MLSLTDVLGWGSMDINFLEDKMAEFNLNASEVFDFIEEEGMADKTDINNWIYATFYIAANNFLDEVKEYAAAENIEFNKNDIDIEIFCNYLDSFLNGTVLNSDIDIMDYSNENLKNFIDLASSKS